MDIQLCIGNLYVSNKPEDSIPIVLPRAHNHMALIMFQAKKNTSNVENEDMSCILYMYIYYICMYISIYVCILYTLSTL